MFTTSSIELAAYLRAMGHRMEMKPKDHLLEFVFPPEGPEDVDACLTGATCEARHLLESFRNLQIFVKQFKQAASRSSAARHEVAEEVQRGR